MSSNAPMLTGNGLIDLPNLIEMAKCKHSKFMKKQEWRLIAVNRAFHTDLWERLEEIEEEESKKRPPFAEEESLGAKKQKTSRDSEDIEDLSRPEGYDEFSDEWLKDIEEYDGFVDWEDSDD
ncbi:hypothetical protein CRE_10416 [Caenorhabditis remanei]|uniref:Uncharacterized protein n=1 Tax=Caenorhabditis remanei TaxID=31234 RepID=E3MQN1_CAERE|nr:hypothetical protein CRE_10416 [Caenorhabditis remanei]